MDIISNIPSELIIHILSFMTTKQAVSTSVLSRGWRNQYKLVRNLEFHDRSGYDTERHRMFEDFVDRMFLERSCGLDKFSLYCYECHPHRVDQWILNTLRFGVLHLHLGLYSYSLPLEVFLSRTLVTLKIGEPGGYVFLRFESNDQLLLPNLKTLFLQGINFGRDDGSNLANILSACPLLEELVMRRMYHCQVFNVSVPSLKKLIISREYNDTTPFFVTTSVRIDTPNIRYLEYTDNVASEYSKINLKSLIEARIFLRLTDDQRAEAVSQEERYISEQGCDRKMIGNAKAIFEGIRNVRRLYLSSSAVEVLGCCCDEIPLFDNLVELRFERIPELGWGSLPKLVKNSLKLETIINERSRPV